MLGLSDGARQMQKGGIGGPGLGEKITCLDSWNGREVAKPSPLLGQWRGYSGSPALIWPHPDPLSLDSFVESQPGYKGTAWETYVCIGGTSILRDLISSSKCKKAFPL